MCISVKNEKKENVQSLMDTWKKLFSDFLRCFVIQLHAVFDLFVDFIFGVYYKHKSKKIPPVKNPLVLESVVDLAEKIRTKKVSCKEVVCAFIERAKEVNSIINAVVEDRYEAAIVEAEEIDSMITKGADVERLKEDKPLLGVPFTTKESNEAEGMLHTMGLLKRRNYRSPSDATAIHHYKTAGAILIAKTNIPELNLWVESRNNLYNGTNNPYDTTRTVGGSSGGEAAIIASCGSAFSVSSDIGGSIRMPAFFCGVFGFKPSGGLTPLKGIGLRSKDYSDSMAEVGPICRLSQDLPLLMKILIKENIKQIKLEAPVDLRNLNIFYQKCSRDIRASSVCGSMKKALLKAVKHLKEVSGNATKMRIPGSEYSFRLWRFWMTKEDLDFKFAITNKTYRASASSELVKLMTGNSELTFAAILKLVDEDFLPKEKEEWATKVTEKMKQYLLDKLGNTGILLYPSSPYPAVYHYSSFLRPYNFGYWCLFNVLRFPVCQVPLGLDDQGLPIGVQVIAAPNNDHLCLAVSRELEKAFGGWVQPS